MVDISYIAGTLVGIIHFNTFQPPKEIPVNMGQANQYQCRRIVFASIAAVFPKATEELMPAIYFHGPHSFFGENSKNCLSHMT